MPGDFYDISNDLTNNITAFLDLEQDLVDRMGDCPNMERKTHGESPLCVCAAGRCDRCIQTVV